MQLNNETIFRDTDEKQEINSSVLFRGTLSFFVSKCVERVTCYVTCLSESSCTAMHAEMFSELTHVLEGCYVKVRYIRMKRFLIALEPATLAKHHTIRVTKGRLLFTSLCFRPNLFSSLELK